MHCYFHPFNIAIASFSGRLVITLIVSINQESFCLIFIGKGNYFWWLYSCHLQANEMKIKQDEQLFWVAAEFVVNTTPNWVRQIPSLPPYHFCFVLIIKIPCFDYFLFGVLQNRNTFIQSKPTIDLFVACLCCVHCFIFDSLNIKTGNIAYHLLVNARIRRKIQHRVKWEELRFLSK